MQNTKTILAAVIALIIGFAAGIAVAPFISPATQAKGRQLPEEIPIGGLFALSGPLSSYGNRHKAAVQLAIEDINKYVQELGLNVKFKLIDMDTKVSKEQALASIQNLAAQGVKVVVGPLASSEVAAVKDFADQNKIVVISHSSTAVTLAIPNDFIFRFVPTDKYQARALALLAKKLGLSKVAVIYRGDEWGTGLYQLFEQEFTAMGGGVKAIKYDPESKELSAEVRQLSDIVKSMGQGAGVLAICFENDGVAILTAAKNDPVLTNVPWMGTDGLALSSKVIQNAGDAAVSLGGVYSTIFTPPKSSKYESFRRRMKEITGEEPDSYSYNIYDATWVAALAILEAGTYDGEIIQKILPDVASRYFGVSGWTLLNENGDRVGGDYVIYKVVQKDGGYSWTVAGYYRISLDKVELTGE